MRALSLASALLVAAALAACTREPARPADTPKPAEPAKPAPDAPPAKETAVNPVDAIMLGSSDSLFLAQVDKASAVFIGKLVELGPTPTTYSGYNVSTQALTYEVVRVLRGSVGPGKITVHQVIVASSPALVDGKPELKPEHTQVGTEYLVALGGIMEGKQTTANENAAPIKATPDMVAKVEAKLKAQP
jgi:hypothetical protein